MTTTITQLRKDIDSARTDLARIEAQQETAQGELSKLEEEVRGLGLDPKANLSAEATRIMGDVAEALSGVKGEVSSIVKQHNTD